MNINKKIKINYFSITILIVITQIAYLNSIYNSFHFDDSISVVENIELKNLANLSEVFSNFGSIIFNRPVTQITFAINYQFSRLNVFGYHLFNITMHCFVVVIVFFLAGYFLLFSQKKHIEIGGNDFSRDYFPFLAAIIFGIHPVFTESVTYISSRSSILLTLMFLLTLIYFIKFTISQKLWYLIMSGLFFTVGMATKTNFIVFPVVVILYLYFFNHVLLGKITKRYKYIIVSLVMVVIAYIVNKFMTQGIELLYLGPQDRQWTPLQYLLTELNVIVFYYFNKLAFPFELSIDPHFPVSNSLLSISLLSLFFLILLIVYALKKKNKPILGFSIIFSIITIAPSSSIVPLLDFVSEHRLYLPGLGAMLLISWLIARCNRVILCVGVIVLLLTATVERNFAWKDPSAIWSDAIRKSPRKARAYYNLAKYYQDTGNHDKALGLYKTASKIVPNVPYPFIAMSSIYRFQGKLSLAEQYIKKALTIRPNDQTALVKLASVYFDAGQYNLAEIILTKKDKNNNLLIGGHQADAFYLLGQIYSIQNKNGLALKQFHKAVKVNPDFPEAYVGIGIIYAKKSKFDLAEEYFRKSINVLKENPGVYFNLGYLYFVQKKYARAIELFKMALKYDSEMDQAWLYLGDSYFELKNYDEALRLYNSINFDGDVGKNAAFKIGLCYLSIVGIGKADEYYSSLMLKEDEDAGLYVQIGKLFEINNRSDLALKYYELATQLNPEMIKLESPEI